MNLKTFNINFKVFMQIFFEKPIYYIMYCLSITTFWYVLFIPVSFAMEEAHYKRNIPDIEINGEKDKIENSFQLFQDLDASMLEKYKKEGVELYSLTARNLFTFKDAYYHVSYRVYGAEDEFINRLSNYLKRGELPKKGEPEAVIGSNVAKFYNLNVGDALKLPITLEKDKENVYDKYIVSGIIAAEYSFFCDGIYISKDTFEQQGHETVENTFYIYTKTNRIYQSICISEDEKNMGQFGEIIYHHNNKVSLQGTINKSLLATIPFSAVILIILFISLMKYADRKIGLMKSIGLSDWHIVKLMMKGFSVANITTLILSYFTLGLLRLIYGFPIPISVMLYNACSFGIIYFLSITIMFILCKKVSPRLAIYPY